MTDRLEGEAGLTLGLTPTRAALLAWAGAWLSGLTLLALDARDPFVRSHAAHAAVVLGGLMAFALGVWGLAILAAFVSPALFRVLAWIASGAWVAFGLVWVWGLIRAARRKPVWLPGFSRLAEKLAR